MNIKSKLLIVSSLLLIFVADVLAETNIGIIFDGYQSNCQIISKNDKFDCNEIRNLFVGDVIIKTPSVEKLKIKWAPYAKGKIINKTTMQVLFVPPIKKESVFANIGDYLGFVKTEHQLVLGATRGVDTLEDLPMPSDNSTVLSGQPVSFVWSENDINQFVVMDEKGTEIFSKKLTNRVKKLSLSPEEMNMKPGGQYFWQLSGSSGLKKYKIKRITDIDDAFIKGELIKIDNNDNDINKIFTKAAYFQMLSETFANSYNLTWLSYQLISNLPSDIRESNSYLVRYISKKYIQTLNDM